VVCFYEGPFYPRNVWSFSKKSGRSRMTESLPADLDPRQLIRPELVRFQSFDERTITGYLYMPPDRDADRPASLIVHPHGGPTSQWKNGWHPFVQFLAQQGYAVFAPNVRGSSGFGLEFENLNDRDWGKGDLEDLIIGTRELMARPEIRSDRTGIWGVSYGGFLTLAAIGKYPDFFDCAIESVGMPDLEKLYRETNTEGRSYLDRELGTLRGNLALYRELSPIRNVEKIETPLLTFHGEDYPLVPLSTKLPFLRALNKPGYPLQHFMFKGDTGRATYRFDLYPGPSRAYMEKILEFIQIYL
jgi:dipeptidyl aminopeptidase/acylaminoacyl peptidase